jgi:hypothetical protein
LKLYVGFCQNHAPPPLWRGEWNIRRCQFGKGKKKKRKNVKYILRKRKDKGKTGIKRVFNIYIFKKGKIQGKNAK